MEGSFFNWTEGERGGWMDFCSLCIFGHLTKPLTKKADSLVGVSFFVVKIITVAALWSPPRPLGQVYGL